MRQRGWVKWFKDDKGYGFIRTDGGEDLFVHHSAIQMSGRRTLDTGFRVEFTVGRNEKGLRAEHVVICSDED